MKFFCAMYTCIVIEMAAYEEESCIHGYHACLKGLMGCIDWSIVCENEPFNDEDRYAVAVLKDDTVVGYIPRKIS